LDPFRPYEIIKTILSKYTVSVHELHFSIHRKGRKEDNALVAAKQEPHWGAAVPGWLPGIAVGIGIIYWHLTPFTGGS